MKRWRVTVTSYLNGVADFCYTPCLFYTSAGADRYVRSVLRYYAQHGNPGARFSIKKERIQ